MISCRTVRWRCMQAHGIRSYVVTLTTGNVAHRTRTSPGCNSLKFAAREEWRRLSELGIPGDHYINLGYDDGLLELRSQGGGRESVRWIRKLRQTCCSPGIQARTINAGTSPSPRCRLLSRRRSACRHVAPALRGTDHFKRVSREYRIPEYLSTMTTTHQDENTVVDISDFVEQKVNAGAKIRQPVWTWLVEIQTGTHGG